MRHLGGIKEEIKDLILPHSRYLSPARVSYINLWTSRRNLIYCNWLKKSVSPSFSIFLTYKEKRRINPFRLFTAKIPELLLNLVKVYLSMAEVYKSTFLPKWLLDCLSFRSTAHLAVVVVVTYFTWVAPITTILNGHI